ncbi:MAG: DUF3419 family protein [Halobacteriovoraceae bacterium]|nr:DUF3419 family protein [Halobacteriovoraceae bacterium]MCB9094024.1 DUF3419 family protein [Halobacteriovoraceae bacterium]
MSEQYFNKLNYTLANEDNEIELKMCQKLKPRHVLAVAGSGGRSLPLAGCEPEVLSVVDLSQDQLDYTLLKEISYKTLSYEDYCCLFGFPPFESLNDREKRKEIFEKIELDTQVKLKLRKIFESIAWGEIIYEGKWEDTFRKFSNLPQKIIGNKTLEKFCSFNTIEEQIEFYEHKFPKWRWAMIIRILGNASVFNSLLYKGSFVKKNIDKTHFQFYLDTFQKLFTTTLLKNNFFVQLCFRGKMYSKEAVTVEANPRYFSQIVEGLKKTKVQYLCRSAVDLDENELGAKIDFFSFSNVPSYFEGQIEQNFMQMIYPHLSTNAHVVIRNYLRIPEGTDWRGYEDVTSEYIDLTSMDKVGVYQIKVYKKIGS